MTSVTKPMMDRGSNGGFEDRAYSYRRTIGRRVKELRLEAGMTQRELGQTVDVDGNAISSLELGRSSVSPERYRHFAEAFGIGKEEWGKWLLRYTNPYLYALIYSGEKDKELERDLKILDNALLLRRKRGPVR